METLKRVEAQAAGLPRYFTWEPCKYGHVTERYTANTRCAQCNRLRMDKWRAAHPEENKRRKHAAYWRDPVASRLASRAGTWRKYGMDPGEAAAALAAHDGKCECCGSASSGTKRDWHIDHDRTTCRVRGVLCHHCNLMLGNAKDDPQTLLKGVAYLARKAG